MQEEICLYYYLMLIVCSLTTSGEVLVTRKSYLDYLKTIGLKNTNKFPMFKTKHGS